jgi:hypothetical protein
MLARTLFAAGQHKKFNSRRTTRDLRTRVAKRTEAGGGDFSNTNGGP